MHTFIGVPAAETGILTGAHPGTLHSDPCDRHMFHEQMNE